MLGNDLRPTHSDRLGRWLGTEAVEEISHNMRDWYGPPIPVRGVPGRVLACGGGDFIGGIDGGAVANVYDFAHDQLRGRMRRWAERQQRTAGAGFASLSDLIAALTANQTYRYNFQRVGPLGVTACATSLWRYGNSPAAGAAAAGQPGGTVPTSATTGTVRLIDAPGGSTTHLYRIDATASVASSTLLVYDRIFAVLKAMNSTAAETITGVPTRYQSSTVTNWDYAGGNFLFVECGSLLASTAHNWTVCTYLDQDGVSSTLPSLTGNAANIAGRLDMPVSMWFAPLQDGDSGIRALTQIQCSAAVATGAIDFVIGHPLAVMPFPVANMGFIANMINDAVNLQRVAESACLALMEWPKPGTGAATYTGIIHTVYG